HVEDELRKLKYPAPAPAWKPLRRKLRTLSPEDRVPERFERSHGQIPSHRAAGGSWTVAHLVVLARHVVPTSDKRRDWLVADREARGETSHRRDSERNPLEIGRPDSAPVPPSHGRSYVLSLERSARSHYASEGDTVP